MVEDNAGSAAERAHWRSLADTLFDGYDPASGVYEQFAGFRALAPLRIGELAPRRPVAAPLLLGYDRVAGAQVLKQGDVLMLHYLLPEERAPGSLPANLDFYEPLTAHGSTLSPGVHAALMARAGRPEQALHWLRTAATVDLDDVGDTTAGGVHLVAMGSVWRAAARGFAGVSPGTDSLLVDPRPLPAQWRSLAVRVVYRGTPVEVRLDAGGVRVTPAGRVAVRVAEHAGRRFSLTDAELACA